MFFLFVGVIMNGLETVSDLKRNGSFGGGLKKNGLGAVGGLKRKDCLAGGLTDGLMLLM